MIKKVLVANRGEIALRVVRACREMGIKTLAVYSEVDEQSLHVQLADEAICIGPFPSKQSYLKIDRILSAAEIGDVDAIHPGYGFLAENPNFAEQCTSCNIKFIGPSAEAIRLMGNKASAKQVARKCRVPVIPGSDGGIGDEKEGRKMAQQVGYPVIIKAVAGGGGKGMRVAHNAVSFTKEFHTAQTEAEKSFGNGAVYIEKLIEEPRHIEFQIAADAHGKIVHFGERDCSVQRRYQKLIEEAPSLVIDGDLRSKMGRCAVKIAEACAYENVGTMEFLLDKDGHFYFIEMNPRIQVEHGVTEEAVGVDLVKLQLSIANGEHVRLEQKQITFKKHAIECRINAENPDSNFAPSPGEISFYCSPGGNGVRIDSHVYGGYVVPPHYDSLIAKVIACGENRTVAMDRMCRALTEYIVRGIHTTIPLCRQIMMDPLFRNGKISTRYINDFLQRVNQPNNTNP
jgi:acetyl-CoA carboxylase biotin carboxylase subunit